MDSLGPPIWSQVEPMLAHFSLLGASWALAGHIFRNLLRLGRLLARFWMGLDSPNLGWGGPNGLFFHGFRRYALIAAGNPGLHFLWLFVLPLQRGGTCAAHGIGLMFAHFSLLDASWALAGHTLHNLLRSGALWARFWMDLDSPNLCFGGPNALFFHAAGNPDLHFLRLFVLPLQRGAFWPPKTRVDAHFWPP